MKINHTFYSAFNAKTMSQKVDLWAYIEIFTPKNELFKDVFNLPSRI